MATTSRRRSIVQGEVFQQALATNYRWWARLVGVDVVLFLGDYSKPGDKLLAAVHRPEFPKGVCQQCGCRHYDPCLRNDARGELHACGWTDATETRCTFCATAKGRRRR